jgi:hypothetical protein
VPPVGVPLIVTTWTLSPCRQYFPDTPCEKYAGRPASEPPPDVVPFSAARPGAVSVPMNIGRPLESVDSMASMSIRLSAANPVKS